MNQIDIYLQHISMSLATITNLLEKQEERTKQIEEFNKVIFDRMQQGEIK